MDTREFKFFFLDFCILKLANALMQVVKNVSVTCILIIKKDSLQQQSLSCHREQQTLNLFLIISTIEFNASRTSKI